MTICILEHDPEKWVPVFPRDKREAFARRSCSNKKIERDDDSKKSHPAPVKRAAVEPLENGSRVRCASLAAAEFLRYANDTN